METESYTLKMGITVSGTKQYESIRVDVSETVTLNPKEQVDEQLKLSDKEIFEPEKILNQAVRRYN